MRGQEVAILLAVHNGARTLMAQLQSYAAQTHPQWQLIAADDGSTDNSQYVLGEFARAHQQRRINLYPGACRGFAQNFLHLLRLVGPDLPFAAFSDQDDVWLPEKLERAVAALNAVPANQPALYCGRTVICDNAMAPRSTSPLFRRRPCFANALVQSIAGGNTMVLNRAALHLAQAASREAGEIASHDWWLYQIVTGAGGQVIYDSEPAVLYRQHSQNLVGANTGFAAKLWRMWWLVQGRFRRWNGANIRALTASAHRLTPENRAILEVFSQARCRPPATRLRLLRRAGLFRQTRGGNATFWCAAAFGLV